MIPHLISEFSEVVCASANANAAVDEAGLSGRVKILILHIPSHQFSGCCNKCINL